MKKNDSLKWHEEMYKRRKFLQELRGGKTLEELIRHANDPKHFKKKEKVRK